MGALLARLGWRKPTTPVAAAGPETAEEAKGEDEFRRDEKEEFSSFPSSPEESTAPRLSESERTGFRTLQETLNRGDDSPGTRPEISSAEAKELQRVQETTVEKEKTIADSGATTEKTVYTQYTESMKVQELKGPIADPFETSQHKPMFPSSFTEFNVSPKSTGSEKEIPIAHPIDEVEVEEQGSNVSDAVVKIQAGVRGYLTRKALKENKKEEIQPSVESLTDLSDNVRRKAEQIAENISENIIQEFRDSSAESETQNGAMFEKGDSKPEGLIGLPMPHNEIRMTAPQSSPSGVDSRESDKLITLQDFPSYAELAEKVLTLSEENKEETPPPDDESEEEEEEEEDSPVISEVLIQPPPEYEAQDDILDENMLEDELLEDEILDDDQKEAATKIQAAFRGYKVRKISKQNKPESAEINSTSPKQQESTLLEDLHSSAIENIMDTRVVVESSLPTAMAPLIRSVDTLSDDAKKSPMGHDVKQFENYSETHMVINNPSSEGTGSYIIGGAQISDADQRDIDDIVADLPSSRPSPATGSETHHQSA